MPSTRLDSSASPAQAQEPRQTSIPEISDNQYYTSMAHFYRGELGRIMAWRQRLDATTNWAIISSTGIVTWGLSHPEITHLVFMLANIVAFQLLTIEARRYRYYDAFRARVRMLEAHFLLPVVLRSTEMLQGNWKRLLAEDLAMPSFKISRREAIGRRLIRNYVYIFLLTLIAWPLKIYLHHGPITTIHEFIQTVNANQPLPTYSFWGFVGAFYLLLIYFIIYGMIVRRASGAFHRRSVKPTKWKM